ncbi:hypothetical protein RBB50_002568 [Rhinocladiella similis]
MSTKISPLTVGVLGPSGMSGSHITLELISRGHKVIGLSRNPSKLGTHSRYEPRTIDLENGTIDEISKTLTDLNVLICAYGPHTSGLAALKYVPFLETLRKIVLASRAAKVSYFIMLGGCGSLYLPGTDTHICAVDSPTFWLAYWRHIASSPAHISYMESRFGSALADGVRAYASARQAWKEGRDTPEARFVRDTHETNIALGEGGAKPLITACRTSFMFFDGNTSFDWTFMSPPAMYRSGAKTGKYEVQLDYLPIKGDPNDGGELNGRFEGISTFDLALAIADEAETRNMKGKHWTAWAEIDNEKPATAPYIDLSHEMVS